MKKWVVFFMSIGYPHTQHKKIRQKKLAEAKKFFLTRIEGQAIETHFTFPQLSLKKISIGARRKSQKSAFFEDGFFSKNHFLRSEGTTKNIFISKNSLWP